MIINLLQELHHTNTDSEPVSEMNREEKILSLLYLVQALASRLFAKLPGYVSKDDLISAGILGLIDAVDRYDNSRGCSLKTYASLRIRGAMVDELRSQDWVPRSVHRDERTYNQAADRLSQSLGREASSEEIRKELNMSPETFETFSERISTRTVVSLDAALEDSEGNTFDLMECTAGEDQPMAFDKLLLKEDLGLLHTSLNRLPAQHKKVLSLYYLEDLRLRDIAQTLRVTESRVSQIHTEAIRLLTAEFRRQSDTDLVGYLS